MDGSRFQPNPGSQAFAPRRDGALFEQAELWLPVKTAEGQAEIRQRQRGLSQRQRTMLLLVDGRRSVAQVKHVAVQAGATDTCFDELLDLGLIAVREPVAATVPAALPLAAAVELAVPLLSLPQVPVSLEPTVPSAVIAPGAPVELVSMQIAEEPVAPAAAVPLLTLPAVVPAKPARRGTSGFTPLAEERIELRSEFDAEPRRGPNTRSGGPGIVDSMMSSLFPLLESAFGALGSSEELGPRDDALEEARRILVREIKAKAPVAGSFTLMKLRRARNRDELSALFDEVDSHISKPMRHLSAQQTLLHVRGLLAGAPSEAWPSRV